MEFIESPCGITILMSDKVSNWIFKTIYYSLHWTKNRLILSIKYMFYSFDIPGGKAISNFKSLSALTIWQTFKFDTVFPKFTRTVNTVSAVTVVALTEVTSLQIRAISIDITNIRSWSALHNIKAVVVSISAVAIIAHTLESSSNICAGCICGTWWFFLTLIYVCK